MEMNAFAVICIAVGGFFVIDGARALLLARGRRRITDLSFRSPDPACMRLGERMERQADYVRRVERQG
jgi:hypothetical protein